MKMHILPDAKAMGAAAAKEVAQALREAIARHGEARIVLSTGESQFTMFEALVQQDVDWAKVEMFHLDEYVGISDRHPASFRKYLKERFIEKVGLQNYHFVDADPACIPALTKLLREKPIHLGLIGIGRNGHIAFNDPPADFDTDEAYIVVTLDTACRMQQVAEGWYPDIDAVPSQAISMTCRQIMACEKIISVVPYAEKADAVAATLASEVTNAVPATLMKTHADLTLYCDEDAAAKADLEHVVMPEGRACEIFR
ncbi:MAG: 6-phosphogluconolactonase [Eubacteriales bacterium]|nr:6-phosphogluconolactonase [Eubacteriales bacterium]